MVDKYDASKAISSVYCSVVYFWYFVPIVWSSHRLSMSTSCLRSRI